jgi:hypothetical protein
LTGKRSLIEKTESDNQNFCFHYFAFCESNISLYFLVSMCRYSVPRQFSCGSLLASISKKRRLDN